MQYWSPPADHRYHISRTGTYEVLVRHMYGADEYAVTMPLTPLMFQANAPVHQVPAVKIFAPPYRGLVSESREPLDGDDHPVVERIRFGHPDRVGAGIHRRDRQPDQAQARTGHTETGQHFLGATDHGPTPGPMAGLYLE
jgi:hypothetical protein